MHKKVQSVARVLACCVLAATAGFASAQSNAPAKPAVGTPQAPAEIYGKMLSMVEKQLVDAVEAMPEDKFDFAPSQGEFKGVRTFGAQVKHLAEANAYFFHDPTKPPSDMKDVSASIEKLTTKADIVKALKDSLAQAHTFVDGITPENAFLATTTGTRAGMASFGMAHMMDHYGQLVVYLRINGIVPPASRKGGM